MNLQDVANLFDSVLVVAGLAVAGSKGGCRFFCFFFFFFFFFIFLLLLLYLIVFFCIFVFCIFLFFLMVFCGFPASVLHGFSSVF